VVHETVYSYIYDYAPNWKQYLRQKKGKYRRRHGTKDRENRREEEKKRRIDERPAIVELRTEIGHWEGDTIIDRTKKQRMLTHVERMSGFGTADKVPRVTAEAVHAIARDRFKKIPKNKRLTLTRDNGPEFGNCDFLFEEQTNMKVYRARPYHSWERGSNENWNGLLRQFFPKRTDFATVKQADIDQAVRLLNDRPRKRLGYLTPREVFNGRCNSS
jgi:IS30 family transposase